MTGWNRAYEPERRRRKRAERAMLRAPVHSTEKMRCTCWCESSWCWVTAEQVWQGQTLSCGAPGCQPPTPGPEDTPL